MHRVILCRTMRFQMNANLEPRAVPSSSFTWLIDEAKAEVIAERRVLGILALVSLFIFVLLV